MACEMPRPLNDLHDLMAIEATEDSGRQDLAACERQLGEMLLGAIDVHYRVLVSLRQSISEPELLERFDTFIEIARKASARMRGQFSTLPTRRIH
jgi:hypothetical protein